jgi:mannose-1-phosphate guanylyltransferase
MLEAVLLVGGRGTRLRPLTVSTPKPMLPVAGVPFLQHQIAKLHDAGVEHVVLATSYRPEVFEEYFGDGSAFGLQLDCVQELEPLGTGGALRNVADRLTSAPDDPVVILNGDVLSGHDLAGQVQLHLDTDADVTLHLVEVDDARAFGCVPTDEAGRVEAFLEKMAEPLSRWVNAGAYVFRRKVIDSIPQGRPVSVERETFPGLLDTGASVWAFKETAYWLDLGTPASFVRGSRDLVLGNVTSSAVPGPTGQSLLLPGAAVLGAATVCGGSVVGANAVVGDGAMVDGSVLLDGATIGPGARVISSVVGVDAAVGAGCVLEDCVVADRARLGVDLELVGGARVWPDVVLPDRAIRFSSDE